MTKRSVSPQSQSESNKRQRGEQATDGISHSNNQLTQASIKDLTKHGLMDIETQSPGIIKRMAEAACEERAEALNNIAAALGLFDKDELVTIETKAPRTIRIIAVAANKGRAEEALNSIAETLEKLDKAMLLDIETQASSTVNNIAEAVITGHPKAFLAVLDYFLIVENNKPKCNLPKCIKDSIRQGKYGRGLSFVMVAAEIKKRYPSYFKKVCTNEFIDVMKWYDSITALDKFVDILDYIKKTVLNYNTQDTAQWSIKFLDKLIEFYDESKPCSIGGDMSDFYDFIKKIEYYKSQYANVTHSDKKSVEKQLVDFMAPTSEHVVASNGLFSESYCAFRDKYKTLVLINKSAGGLLHLDQHQTLLDAHNEIVALFRHFILCLQDDLSACQVTFCYDDIDYFLRRYDFAEARQLLLADLQYLDRHHPQHALFKAYS